MKRILIILVLLPCMVTASDSFDTVSGLVHMPIVNVGNDKFEVDMIHQGDFIFKVVSVVPTSATAIFSDSYDLETETLQVQNVSVGADNFEATLIHLGNLIFKVTSASSIIKKGRFIDSPVEGLSFRTESRIGVTNANGEFSYVPGEVVVFGLGDLEFPAVEAAQVLTPLELAGVTDINDTGVVNMARLLQTLDKDCNANNGITLSGEVLLSTAQMEIDFESPSFDREVADLVNISAQQTSSCNSLISESQAVQHLQASLNELNNQANSPIGNGLSGKIGIWEGVGQQQGFSWTIRIDIKGNEQNIEYPSLNCGGFLTLLEETDSQLLLREKITFGLGSCLDNGFVELTDQSESELVYRWYHPDSNDQKGELGAIGSVTKVQ